MASNFWRQVLKLLKKKLEANNSLQSEVDGLLRKPKITKDDLEKVLQNIGEQDQFLVLLLDDYDVALRPHNDYTEADIENFLFDCRYLASREEQSQYLSMIVASLRRLNDIGPKLAPNKSPWYNHYIYEPLKPFTEEEVAALLASMPMTPALREGIREIADGNPALLQNAFYQLYNQQGVFQIPEPKTFVQDFLTRTEQFFQQTWELSNEVEQTLLMLIALYSLRGRVPHQRFDIGNIDAIFSQKERELNDLEQRGVIISKLEGRKKIYSFASSLMEWWVVKEIQNSNEVKFEQRRKGFLNIMSHRQADRLTAGIRRLWNSRQVPIDIIEYFGKLTAALPKGFTGLMGGE